MQRHIRATLIAAVALVAALAVSGSVRAGSGGFETGNVFGEVADSHGAPLANVVVTLSGASGTQVQASDGQGRFQYVNLLPGVYALKAELGGFATYENSVVIAGSQNIVLQLTLRADAAGY